MARALALGAACAALAALGCGPKVVREPIVDTQELQVQLRHELAGGEPLARGYEHPVTISQTRLVHILASLDWEDSNGERAPVFRSEHLYPLAQGLGEALAKATPADEVAAALFPQDRRFTFFTVDRVTSFRAFARHGQLVLELFSVEHQREDDRLRRPYEIPLEPPSGSPSFRLLAGKGIAPEGKRSLVIDWRNEHFRRPASLTARGGRVSRRTVLMESENEGAGGEVSPASSEAQLRALDQLDAARRSGALTEAEFQRRRRLILECRLEEAGYPPKAP